MLKIENKKRFVFILVLVLVVILTAGTVFTIKIIKDVNAANQQSIDGENPTIDTPSVSKPTLSVIASIEIDKYETYNYTYSVTDLGDYVASVEIVDNTIAKVDDNLKIKPIKVGTTDIKVSINCEPKIEKFTTLIIKDAVSDYSYEIINENGEKCDYLYVNNYYILQITENAIVDEIPKIGYDDDFVSNVLFISKDKNILKYKFKVKNYGNFVFKYESKYCKKDTGNLTAYEYPNNFNVAFNNNVLVGNNINLYLYNEDYTSDANIDGYYNSTMFNIGIKPNTNDKVNMSFVGDCISIKDNKISAIKVGTGSLVFESEISKVKKEYEIIVQKIEPTAVVLNGQENQLCKTINLSLEQNTLYNFDVQILPAYAYGNLSYICSSGVSFADSKVSLIADTSQNIKVMFNSECILSVNITKTASFEIVKEIYGYDNFVVNDNYLTIVYEEDCEISIFLVIKNCDDNSMILDCVYGFTISDESVITKTNDLYESTNGLIKVCVLRKGVAQLTIFNEKYNLSLTINIEIR